jgi:acyl-CoA thioester hydrolase
LTGTNSTVDVSKLNPTNIEYHVNLPGKSLEGFIVRRIDHISIASANLQTMPESFRTSRRVEFRDTDAAGIVHFSVFFTYMEQAEHEMLRSVGLNVMTRQNDRTISWPRVQAGCNYRRAIRFEEVIDITVVVKKIGIKSVQYGFEFSLDSQRIADGEITVVCCEVEHGKPPLPIEIPQSFREALSPFQVDPNGHSSTNG